MFSVNKIQGRRSSDTAILGYQSTAPLRFQELAGERKRNGAGGKKERFLTAMQTTEQEGLLRRLPWKRGRPGIGGAARAAGPQRGGALKKPARKASMFVEVVRPGRSTRGGDAKRQLRIEERNRRSCRAALLVQLLCFCYSCPVKIRASLLHPTDNAASSLVCTKEEEYPFFSNNWLWHFFKTSWPFFLFIFKKKTKRKKEVFMHTKSWCPWKKKRPHNVGRNWI